MERLKGKTFSEWVVRQPIRLGGMGLRSLVDLSPAAFVGAVEQAIPSFYGEKGVCPVLATVVGGIECFGKAAPSDTRWRVMFQSGCRFGQEYKMVWDLIGGEAEEGAAYLGEKLGEHLGATAAGAGQGWYY